ncbi:MAG: hypothetical protein JST84_04720 [Acidobacteria bacterium]|nr:hypothetical protein [Acidobacteriota bacterium]
MKTFLTITCSGAILLYFCACTFVAAAQQGQKGQYQPLQPLGFSGNRQGPTFSIANTPFAGTYECPDQKGINEALTAIGLTDIKQIQLLRSDEQNHIVEVTIRLESIRKKEIPDTLVRSGDTLYVKRSKAFKVFNVLTLGILGKVKKS